MRPRVEGMVWLPKDELDPNLIKHFRKELTIIPRKARGYDDEPAQPVRCYQETPFEFGVPRSFWFRTASQPYEYEWDISFGEEWESPPECCLTHEGPYAEQGEVISLFEERCWQSGPDCTDDEEVSDQEAGLLMGGIFQADTGFGKCLGRGTPVLLHDGRVVPVETVQAGDALMGPDGGARRVLSTATGRGPLFEVVPKKGPSWICNDVHVLTLVKTNTGDIIDIPLNEYLEKPNGFKHLWKLFRPNGGVDFPSSGPLPLDPYFFGVWLGDGDKGMPRGRLARVAVTKPDPEIHEICQEVARDWGCEVRTDEYEGKCPTYRLVTPEGEENGLLGVLRELFPSESAGVPERYLTASRHARLELLAGLLDTDGHRCFPGGPYEISQKRVAVADGIERLAFGLGFMVTRRPKMVRGESYELLFISGDVSRIPLRIKRKKAVPRRQRKNCLRSGFEVVPRGDGEFFGFTLDQDGRFLLGDCTVTHNTDTTLGLINRLQRTTLIIVHKEFLQTQWVARAEKWLPGIKIGIVREDRCDFEDKHLVVAMAQSLALEDGSRYPAELYSWPGLLVIDETHRVAAPTWAPLPPRFSSAWRLGLTATPRRKDGADNVFWWHIGPIVYKAKTRTPKPKVRMIKTTPGVPSFVKRENVKAPLVVNVLVKLKNRNAMIVAEMMKALKAPAQRKLFVLSERLEHLRQLEGALQSAWQGEMGEWLATGFYTGEWFTGDVRPKLAPRTWKMKDGGRERAIETIYRSMARRWKGEGELKPCILTDKKTMEKRHSLILQWGDVAAIQGIVTDPDDDLEWVHVLLEDLEDQHLYEMASRFQIAQKKVEKKRRQTREELHEAERARVIFATFQMCSEGVDLPAIDTEFLVSPVADVEQAVGRVRRNCSPEPAKCAHFCPWRAGKCEGKPVPIVCDIVDLGIPLASKREGYRRDFYESLGTVVAG